jgi:17beta-estradiol 17-dehydrogenase / very-long-chain 3-oxoacyl-CoA reductase
MLFMAFIPVNKFYYPYARPSNLKKYFIKDAYTVVTGSTDGIGKAIALELAHSGFNIVLHGRNIYKLQAVEKEIRTNFPGRDVICLQHDGSKDSQMNIESIKHLPVNVLINNVGVGPIKELAELSNDEIHETITLNTKFPSQLTRNLLPQLSKHPALILNVSSYAGLFPPPYLVKRETGYMFGTE